MSPEHVASIRVDVFRIDGKFGAQAQPIDMPVLTLPVKGGNTPLIAAMLAVQDCLVWLSHTDQTPPDSVVDSE